MAGAPKGNQNATKAERLWASMVRRKVAQNPNQLEKAALAVLNAAADGEPWAVTELRNTLDGKPVQQIDHTGDFGQRLANELSNRELEMIAAGHDPSAPEATEATGSTIN